MIRDSFKTIFKNPSIIFGCIIPITALLICLLPVMGPIFGALTRLTMGMIVPLALAFTCFLLFCFSLIMTFVYMPGFLNYVYEVLLQKTQKGKFGRGIKRSWWKIFVNSLIASVVGILLLIVLYGISIFVIGSVFPLHIKATVCAIALYLVLLYFADILIFMVSVVVEDDYGDGLKYGFKFGLKNRLKVMAVCLVVLAGIAAMVYVRVFHFGGFTEFVLFARASQRLVRGFLVLLIALVSIGLSGIISSFILVYVSKLYINRREELREMDAQKLPEQQEQTSAEE